MSRDLKQSFFVVVKNRIKTQLKLLFDAINLILKRAIIISLEILFHGETRDDGIFSDQDKDSG